MNLKTIQLFDFTSPLHRTVEKNNGESIPKICEMVLPNLASYFVCRPSFFVLTNMKKLLTLRY